MTDTFSPEVRSRVMAQVRSRGNKSTEERLVHILRKNRIIGWRRHLEMLGNPDFVFPRERVVLFVDGCFWHGCECKTIPVANRTYWTRKIGRNAARDRRVTRKLRGDGWSVVRVWEHSLEHPERVVARLRRVMAGR